MYKEGWQAMYKVEEVGPETHPRPTGSWGRLLAQLGMAVMVPCGIFQLSQ